jgi:hypothetical protein
MRMETENLSVHYLWTFFGHRSWHGTKQFIRTGKSEFKKENPVSWNLKRMY